MPYCFLSSDLNLEEGDWVFSFRSMRLESFEFEYVEQEPAFLFWNVDSFGKQ